MNKFGWSLPPGCTNRNIDEAFGTNQPCVCCGNWIDNCICPECPKCESVGDPACYIVHDLKFSKEQLAGQDWLKNKAPRMKKFEKITVKISYFLWGVFVGYVWCYYHWTH